MQTYRETGSRHTPASFLQAVAAIGLFAIPAAMLYVPSSGINPNISGKTEIFRFVILGVVGIMAITRYVRLTPLLLAFGVYVAATAISDLRWMEPGHLFDENFRMDGFLATLTYLGYLAALSLLTPTLWRWFLWAWAASCSVVALSGVISMISAAFYAGILTRVGGIIPNADFFAVYLLFGVFFSLLLRADEEGKLRRLLDEMILLQIVMIVFSASRSVLLGLLAGSVIIGWNYRRTMLGIGAAVAIAAVAGQVFSQTPILTRFMEADIRPIFWPLEMKLVVANHPFLGWGQGGTLMIFGRTYLDRAHNLIIDLLLVGGVVGMAAYLAVLGIAAKMATMLDKVEERAIAIAALAAYFITTMFTFDTISSYVPLMTLLGWIDWRYGKVFTFGKVSTQRVVA